MPLVMLLQSAEELQALGGLFEKIGGMPTLIGGLTVLLSFPLFAIGVIGFVLWRVTESARKEREKGATLQAQQEKERDEHYERIFGSQATALSDLARETKNLRESMEEGRRQHMEKDGQVATILQGILTAQQSFERRLEAIEREMQPKTARAA